MNDCLVLFPLTQRVPKSIIHFIGGFVAGSAVNIAYASTLEYLAAKDYLVIATPIAPFDTDHEKLSQQAADMFYSCYTETVLPIIGGVNVDSASVPIIGMGHSLGGKLLVCMNSLRQANIAVANRYQPTANIFLAFNNYGAQDSLEMTKRQISQSSPELKKILDSVNIPQIKKIVQDTIGQSGNIGTIIKESIFGSLDSFERDLDRRKRSNNVQMDGDAVGSTFGDDRGSSSPVSGSEFDSTVADFVGDFFSGGLVNNIRSQVSRAANNIDEAVYSAVNENDFFSDLSDFEFNPTPKETIKRLNKSYQTRQNVLFKFTNDEIDQSVLLQQTLLSRGCVAKTVVLTGNHLTPCDAVGSASSEEFLAELIRQLQYVTDPVNVLDYRVVPIVVDDEYQLPPSGSRENNPKSSKHRDSSGRWDSDDV